MRHLTPLFSVSQFGRCIRADEESQAVTGTEVEDKAPSLLQTGWPNVSRTLITISRKEENQVHIMPLREEIAHKTKT
jgi:hypothetical protein